MINSKQDLAEFMKLELMKSKHPTPLTGEGGNVAEIHKTYSWECVLQAAIEMTDQELSELLDFSEPISFHNNSNSGHTSHGASWSIKYFLEYNGGGDIRKRISDLKLS